MGADLGEMGERDMDLTPGQRQLENLTRRSGIRSGSAILVPDGPALPFPHQAQEKCARRDAAGELQGFGLGFDHGSTLIVEVYDVISLANS